jgi:hypothetical protein
MVAVSGHFGGSCDGHGLLRRYGLVDPVLLEFKTSSTGKGFQALDLGVQDGKPQHWAQMCTYGVGFNIRYAVYICINKNDDDLHLEVLELDHELGRAMLDKASRIVRSTVPPPKLSENPSYYECKWCHMNRVCHMGDAPERNCRSCANASPGENATWECSQFGEIPKEFIAQGCSGWKSITD